MFRSWLVSLACLPESSGPAPSARAVIDTIFSSDEREGVDVLLIGPVGLIYYILQPCAHPSCLMCAEASRTDPISIGGWQRA